MRFIPLLSHLLHLTLELAADAVVLRTSGVRGDDPWVKILCPGLGAIHTGYRGVVCITPPVDDQLLSVCMDFAASQVAACHARGACPQHACRSTLQPSGVERQQGHSRRVKVCPVLFLLFWTVRLQMVRPCCGAGICPQDIWMCKSCI